MRIYIAGPYSAPDDSGKLANTERAMAMGHHLLAEGYIPFIPHLTHYFDLWVERESGERLDSAIYYKYDLEWLDACDAIILLDGWEKSKGAVREREAALAMGLTIYHEGEL